MSLLPTLLFFAFGLLILVKGANYLVEGASSIATKFNIPPIVIGLTIVSLGTSAPELIVSMTSALNGSTDLALGNVIGSNIVNTLVILGVSAFICPLIVKKNTVWKEIPMSLLAAIMIAILGLGVIIDNNKWSEINLQDGQNSLGYLGVSAGLVLLSFFAVFMSYTFGIAKTTGEATDDKIEQLSNGKSILFVIGGLIALTLGGRLAVDNAVQIASSLGMTQKLIGLTIVAIGTSLPELVTSITAATKNNSDIAIGNVIGSNIFNIFLILGLTSVVSPIPIYGQSVLDILFLILINAFLFISVFIFKKYYLGKIEGVSMVLAYLAYATFLIWRAIN